MLIVQSVTALVFIAPATALLKGDRGSRAALAEAGPS